jgi:hypothetical protein
MSAGIEVVQAQQSDERSEAESVERDGGVTVLHTEWEGGDEEPPSLRVELSNGSSLVVRYDVTYSYVEQYLDRAAVTDAATKLPRGVISALREDVAAAAGEWLQESACNRADSHDDAHWSES